MQSLQTFLMARLAPGSGTEIGYQAKVQSSGLLVKMGFRVSGLRSNGVHGKTCYKFLLIVHVDIRA